MGLFGEVDASEVSDNPWYVPEDTYKCVLTEAGLKTSTKNDKEGLAFKWVIEEDDSEYDGNSISDWLTLHRDKSKDELTADDRRDNSRTKIRLTQMGVSELQMDTLLDEGDETLDELIGLIAYVTVKETRKTNDEGDEVVYTNISKVEVIE